MEYQKQLVTQIKQAKLDPAVVRQIAPLLDAINKTYQKNEGELLTTTQKAEENSIELTQKNTYLKNNIKKIRERLTKVAGNIKEIIYELDSDGNFSYLNCAWEDIIGVSVEESLGKPYNFYLKDEQNQQIVDLIDLKTNILSSLNKTVQILSKKRGLIWLEFAINPVLDNSGKPEAFVGTISDVTTIKKTEIHLIAANKAKSDFLSTMSHEIRTPLNAVIGIAHLLLIENPKAEQLENLSTLKYSSEHLLAVVNDILDYNKIVSGSLELEQASFSLQEVLTTVESILKNKATGKNVHFQICRDSLIQDTLIGDKTRLSQVLTNLIGNAIKFTDAGAVTLDVNLESETEDSSILRFEIKDTGIGIPEDKIDKIFESFAQAGEETTRLYGGTGLGLAICQKLLALMGSDIKVESTYGLGSTFHFPIHFKKGNPIEALLKKDTTNTTNDNIKRLKGMKVLVVEDNKINILVIEKFLKKWELDYDFAQNGQIAVQSAFKKEYDLILMDIQMPIMNGFDASIAIRASDNAHNKTIPIYALTASTGEDIIKDVLSHGMNGLIGKPFKPNELVETMLKTLDLKQLESK